MKRMGAIDTTAVAKHAANLDGILAVYDGILARQRYLAGDQITVADLSHLPCGKVTRDHGFKELYEKYPNVKRWWDGLEARESWKEVIKSSS
jgi:glutathione S-transferase